ncbi:MAG: S-methyl-5-thioribose-1-phosphate isomerase, partial [Bacteroidota bacterium]
MKIGDRHYRTIWPDESDETVVKIIDQRWLPHQFVIEDLRTVEQVATAIADMHVRGAGLIGATASYGMYLAMLEAKTKGLQSITTAAEKLKASRPTAVNLEWAVDRQINHLKSFESLEEKIKAAKNMAEIIADEDAKGCEDIGKHGVAIIEELAKKKGGDEVNILTHCNAGWLAFVDY